MPSTSWNRLFRCFEDCRVEAGGILVDTVFGDGDRLGVDVSEFPEALPVCLLVVPAWGHFSCIGVDLLGKGQDYRFVVTASKLLTDFSFSNLLDVVCGYGNIRCAGCFPHSWIEGWGISWGVDEDQAVANNPVFHFFSFCVYTGITPTRGVAVKVPYNHSVFAVWLKNLEIDCFVGRTVEVTDGQVSVWENEFHGDVFRVSFLWSLDLCGWYAGFNKCKHSTFGSVCSVNSVYLISPDGESVRVVEMGLLDAADVNFLYFEELLKFKFLLSHPFCIPMHDAKCLVTGSSTLSSPGHQKRIRAAVSRIGWAPLRLRARRRPTLAAAHQDDTTTIQR